MEIETAWVRPPPQIGGLDHLAVQAPCINIYSRMLPGITNVTDRARYYSFYPWLIWALDQAGHRKYDKDFIERFRRADVLFCLIAQRHAQTSKDERAEDHAAALVGSDTLREVAQNLGASGSVRLSDYSLHEGAKRRYFANLLGGLGQYYIGVLRELSILDGDLSSGVKYSTQIGQLIAERMDAGVARALFLKVVEADLVSAAELDTLYSFCPCQLARQAEERAILGELFFMRGLFYFPATLTRRQTLQSILHLAGLLDAESEEISERLFRACAYAGSLPSGKPWTVPETLASNREKWAIYARNELLSVAVQGLFFAVLDALEDKKDGSLRFFTSAEIVDWFLEQAEAKQPLDEIGPHSFFAERIASSSDWLPPLDRWSDELHEVHLAESIVTLSGDEKKSPDNRRGIIAASLRVLIALASRSNTSVSPYADLVFDQNYFGYYPINLESLAGYSANTWAHMTMREVLRWLLTHWGIETHLRVALRKLRAQGRSTFRIRPTDRGMEVIDIPPAVHTRPRFNQALRVLKDIGAMEKAGNTWRPSAFGTAMLELGDAP